ncbi:hypothetical protein FB45DRAFT_759371 [Roridomyces roridus]|uniref:Amidohydrolase-related domain-containing protein n=1 Tax=Roridomyces roridus TaxID=1738132 RepID=A0AAD7B8C7_9AGAR|nr:hypothetical protein FB45DRAFT_759371 [Roridomyces roridus]
MASPSTILLSNGTVLLHDEKDHVTAVKADILIVDNRIAEIAPGISSPSNAVVINCTGKIVSPGFIDRNAHRTRHKPGGYGARRSVRETTFSPGFIPYGAYDPDDVFWGQLGGCMEALDGGVTMVVDHAHINASAAHSSSALSATESSGIRSYFCYSPIQSLRTASWSPKFQLVPWTPGAGPVPEWASNQLAELAAKQPFGEGRVHLGVSFDAWYLPKQGVLFFENARKLGVKLFTSHYVKNAIIGQHSLVSLLNSYGLLSHDFLLSHATQALPEDADLLSAKNAHISSTPDTELQMAHGTPVCLRPDLYKLSSLGIDCHSNNSGDILSQMRLALQSACGHRNAGYVAQGKVPRTVLPTVEEAFNLGTIMGARAVGMGGDIGSIAVGKLADLVIFDAQSPSMVCAAEEDPVAAIVLHASVRDIETVIVDGKIRKRGGKLVAVDVGERAEGRVLEWSGISAKLIESRKRIHQVLEGMDEAGARAAVIQTFHINEDNIVDVV